MMLLRKRSVLWTLWLSCVLVAPARSCMVMTPKEVRPGVEETVVIFNRDTSRDVTLILQDYPKKEQTIFQRTVDVIGVDVVPIWIDPEKLDDDEVRRGQRLYVSLRVVCGRVFTKEAILPVSRRSGYLLLQSDKPIYTPRQTVNLRMIAVGEDLVPTAGEIKLQIKNPKGAVAHETTLSAMDNGSATGMFSHSYSFPASPELGVWAAVINYGFHLSQETNITFELQEYVLPSFSVKITVPSVILPETATTVTVEAKYPYGEPVHGSATCKFKIRDAKTGGVQPYPLYESRTMQLIGGSATFVLPNLPLWRSVWNADTSRGSQLIIEADVLDKATSERVTAVDDSAIFARSPYRVSFRRTDPTFRPGGPKVVMADIKYANGQPAALVPCTITAETMQGQSIPIEHDIAVTDARGRVAFTVPTERQHSIMVATVQTLLPSELSQRAIGHIIMNAFRSQVNAVLFLESTDNGKTVKVGDIISLRAGIYPPTSAPVYYIVTHNGQVKNFGELYQDDQPGSSYRLAQFPVTADMSPSVRVLAYMFHEGHQLADSLIIEVEEACFERAVVTVEPVFESHRPGASGSVKILGSSGTRVGILGVNKQVSELAGEGLLTSEKLFAKLKSHDMGCGPAGGSTITDVLSKFGVIVIDERSPDIVQGEDTSCQQPSRRRVRHRRLKRFVPSMYLEEPFLKECCLLGKKPDRAQRSCTERSALVRRYISGHRGERCADAYMECCTIEHGMPGPVRGMPGPVRGMPGPVHNYQEFSAFTPNRLRDPDLLVGGRMGPPSRTPVSPTLALDEVDGYDEEDVLPPEYYSIRKDFRETWLFDESVIGPRGVAEIITSIPHSITTWSVQAVSVAPSGGVCIPKPREVRAFQPVFLQVALPYSVVRNEQIEVLATVYNYGNETIRCNVYVYGVEGVCTGTQEGERSERRTVSVNASSASSIAFPVVPLREGRFIIKVHVQCSNDSSHGTNTHDVVEKELHVVPEGVPVEKVVAIPIDPANAHKRAAQRSATDVHDDLVDPVTNHQTISIDLLPPSDAVPDTRSCSLSVTGNRIRPSPEETLDEIEVYMRRPTGSSEENDALMAQTLHTLEYLKRKNLTDRALSERGLRYLRDGYQRQLSYWIETGFFSELGNVPRENLRSFAAKRLTALVTRTLCKARQHISTNDSLISSAIRWLQTQEGSIAFGREWRYMPADMRITDMLMATRALIFVTFIDCAPFIRQERLDTKNEEVKHRLHFDLVELMRMNPQRRNGHTIALMAYAMSRGDVSGYDAALRALRRQLFHEPLQNTKSMGTEKSSITVEGTSYALLALLTSVTNDTDTIQALVNWLNIHRPSSKTSSLRHDSAAALQALMEFDLKFPKPDVDLMCHVTMRGQQDFQKSLQIRPDNAALRQELDIRNMSGTLLVRANGTGSGLLSVRMKYNVLMPPELLCKFNISVQADVRKPKVENTYTSYFPEDLLNELGFDRELRSADLASRMHGLHRIARSSNQPQQSKLVYDIQVCSQYIGELDSKAAVIEVGLLSGFEPVVEDLDEAKKSNTNLVNYLITEKKVILYFNQISRQEPTCVLFGTERKHVIHNIQSAAVKVYDHSDPSRSCTQFYGLGSTSPLLKLACEGSKCQCIEAQCPRRQPFLDIIKVPPLQIKRQMLLEMACREHDFVWIGSISENKVISGFRHIYLHVNTVLKEGAETRQSVLTGTKLFISPHHCTTADLSVGDEYFVFGQDGESFMNNGSVGVRYNMDKHVRLFNIHSRQRLRWYTRLSSIFHWLSSELQKHKGCPSHLRVVRSAPAFNA